MAQPPDHPVVKVFSMIRLINDGVRDLLMELLPPELGLAEFDVLRVLDSGDGVTSAQIAHALHEPEPGMGPRLQSLVNSGFVRVEEGGGGRVWLTPAGMAIYSQSIAAIRPQMEKLREAFTLDEFREVLPFLKGLQTWFAERDWAETAR